MLVPRGYKLRHFQLIVAVALLAGCTITIPAINPSPNIALVQQQKSLALTFGPGVKDQLNISAGNNTVEVQSWHQTLENGFHNGFSSAFPSPPGARPDLVLRIDEARLEIGSFDDKSLARIQYAVTLSGADGVAVRRTAGAASRAAPSGAPTVTREVIADVDASIDAMFEQIARDLFIAPAPAPTVGRCIPGQSIACVGPKGCQGFQVCASDGSRYESCSCGN